MNKQKIKQIPFYFEIEQAILGIIFLKPECITMVNNYLKVNDFFDSQHQNIFQVMQELSANKQKIDYYTVETLLKTKNQWFVNANDYLINLGDLIIDINNLETYLTLVKSAAVKRQTIKVLQDLLTKSFQNDVETADLLNLINRELIKLNDFQTTEGFLPQTAISAEFMADLITRQNNQTNMLGFCSGFNSLDNITLGFKPGELIILAARPGMGKSAFMNKIMTNMAQIHQTHKPHIALINLEMSNKQTVLRMISNLTKINHHKIQLAQILNPQENAMIKRTLNNQLNNFNFLYDDNSNSDIQQIQTTCYQLKNQNKLDVLIIDYLQLIHKKNPFNRENEIATITRMLKALALDLKIPVLALSQLSREVEKRENKRPILADLRDSGAIEQDADVVIFLYREDYYDKKTPKKTFLGEMELIIAKNRHGMTGIKKIDFDFTTFSFSEKIDEC
ncbi:replicative DNA helicase [Candidatus Phytoplasma prunorum]|uniref:replicative DNA helicase n=1 Tax=Candidatus Phytoplasma prunorum TaxID=47565 RepID=UPI002FF0A994